LDSGTAFNWKGKAIHIPGNYSQLYVSVRAANGQAYATLPNYVEVGFVYDVTGEGETGAWKSTGQGSSRMSFSNGLWGYSGGGLYQGPTFTADVFPGLITPTYGDRFLIGSMGNGTGILNQKMTDSLGWPSLMIDTVRDGIGMAEETIGERPNSQTIGLGDGTNPTWCSATTFCTNPGVSGKLIYNGASLTGGQFSGSVGSGGSANVLTVGTISSTVGRGAVAPGLILSGAGISGSPTLVNCLTGCTSVGSGSTWMLSASIGPISSEPMRADPVGGALWPLFNIQQGSAPIGNSGFSTSLIKAGTFKVSVNGTVVCQDSTPFTYNNEGGNCAGAGIASSFVNYLTGDYSITFSSAPTGPIIASWTNIESPDTSTANRPFPVDIFGDGTEHGGFISASFGRSPGGVNGHIFSGGNGDETCWASATYQACAPGYTQMITDLYDKRFPSVIPGQTASTPLMVGSHWRDEGPTGLTSQVVSDGLKAEMMGEWSRDVVTKSNFSGTIVHGSNILTLTAATTDPMWEGEVVGCNPFSLGCQIQDGTYIQSLASGAWGASGSTYNIVGDCLSTCTALALENAVYYQGVATPIDLGTENDTSVEPGNIAQAFHLYPGIAGAGRVSRRWAASIYGALSNPGGPPVASEATLDRVKADVGGGCDSGATAAPCFDTSGAYGASATATWAGNMATITGGLVATDRPFVVGMGLFCSGCNSNLVITGVSVPPTQSTISGAGEVGQTFTITANAAIGGSGSGTLAGGCVGTSGVGSNCIDIAFSINTTGTYGTPASLATCGENNLNGNASINQPPNGVCHSNGVGSLVRGFRIGTGQNMWGAATNGSIAAGGSPYDDGKDIGGVFKQNGAFTCNIVAPTVVQCVHGPIWTAGVPSLGQWSNGLTYVSYGDGVVGTGMSTSLLGNVGGRSFNFTAGSGYDDGTFTVGAEYASCNFNLNSTFTVNATALVPLTGNLSTITLGAGSTAFAIGQEINVPGYTTVRPLTIVQFGSGATGEAGDYIVIDPNIGNTFASTSVTVEIRETFNIVPMLDITTLGGKIVNAYPSPTIGTSMGLGVNFGNHTGTGLGCNWPVQFPFTATIASNGNMAVTLPQGNLYTGMSFTIPSVGTFKITSVPTGNGAGTYATNFSGTAITSATTFFAGISGSGTGGAIAIPPGSASGWTTFPVTPFDGQYGPASYNTDNNMMGDLLYDNSGHCPDNPLCSFFTNGMGGYFEPGLPVKPFGLFMGAAVSG
jgi:hypothetical protein